MNEDDVMTANQMWSAFTDPNVDMTSMVWMCEVSFPFTETSGHVREILLATDKHKIIDLCYELLAKREVARGCGFDAGNPFESKTKIDTIRRFFDGVQERNLFIGLVRLY